MIFASGGLRSGIDVAKCVALGATAGGMAGPLLTAAAESTQSAIASIEQVKQTLRLCMFATGCENLTQLASAEMFEL